MNRKMPRGPSRTGSLAFEDREFLMREEIRPNRLALEFTRADLELRDKGVESIVVVFGSSRARAFVQRTKHTKPSVDGGTSGRDKPHVELSRCYDLAREFARIVSERGGALRDKMGVRENVITTGGGPGIMEAANRGASDVGAPSIGFNIELPNEQEPNKYITPGLCFQFHYFAVRKMHFAMRANALAVFPRGFGTLDELFEILTLKQTRKTPGMPVILFCRSYWERIINFSALCELGTIDRSDLALFQIVDSAEEGWQAMLEHGLTTPTPLSEV